MRFFVWLVFVGCCLTSAGCGKHGQVTEVSLVRTARFSVDEKLRPPFDSVEISPNIVVDQFGYLPDAPKVAVIRNPRVGFDADVQFKPGDMLQLINVADNHVVVTAAPSEWNVGLVDPSSGDQVWWFDFSSVEAEGRYTVVDTANRVRSPIFKIAHDVYKPLLKLAFRTFFYQRSGFAKVAPYAESGWVDGRSHVGPGQDKNARLYSDKGNPATERDLSGGWYDAGDYNKYTSWGADYVVTLLQAYAENPAAWGDDFNIPESGNGIPDVLDEVKWELDWLVKMQKATGSGAVLSIVGVASASPPSAATGPSFYGPVTTNATVSCAAAFALAARVFRQAGVAELADYSDDLERRAIAAWSWAAANHEVAFKNNDQVNGSAGLGAGQQEPVDASGNPDANARETKFRIAAVYLYAMTRNSIYKDYVELNYRNSQLRAFADPFREFENASLLYYSSLDGVSAKVAQEIKSWFRDAMGADNNWISQASARDPYRAYLDVYVWGSNSAKAAKGSMFADLAQYEIAGFDPKLAREYSLGYLNYIHGVNPLGMVYLSNMYSLGVHRSVNEFWHTWFTDGSNKWDRVGESTYGPPPGFLVGGPNASYDWDGVCAARPDFSKQCGVAAPSPPKSQPSQKSYKDFNTNWPLNAWAVTENSCSYQSNYLRLLSKFIM